MAEIEPDMCSCCEEIWNRENLKNIPLGGHKLHLCPDCYREYIISNNNVLERIKDEFISLYPKNYAGELELGGLGCVFSLNKVLNVIDKYKTRKGGMKNERNNQ